MGDVGASEQNDGRMVPRRVSLNEPQTGVALGRRSVSPPEPTQQHDYGALHFKTASRCAQKDGGFRCLFVCFFLALFNLGPYCRRGGSL